MQILLDHNVPWGLRKPLSGHRVSRAWLMGWASLRNGKLLSAAERTGFDLFLTGDQNIRYQQNLSLRRIAIMELTTIHWRSLQVCLEAIASAVDTIGPGEYHIVDCLDLRYTKRKFTRTG